MNSPLVPYDVGVASSINSVYFINETTGFLCGDAGVVYKSVNGGVNWTSK